MKGLTIGSASMCIHQDMTIRKARRARKMHKSCPKGKLRQVQFLERFPNQMLHNFKGIRLLCINRVIQQEDGNVISERESARIVWTRPTSTSGVSVAALPNRFRTLFRWFSRRDQNAWDLRKFCAYKRDNAVWNYFRTHFQDNLVHFFVLFGVFGKIYRFIYSGFPKGNNRWQAPDPIFKGPVHL